MPDERPTTLLHDAWGASRECNVMLILVGGAFFGGLGVLVFYVMVW